MEFIEKNCIWQFPTHQSNFTRHDWIHPKAKLHCYYEEESLCKRHAQDETFEQYNLEDYIKNYSEKYICPICLKKFRELVDKATPLMVNYISYGDADGYPVYDTIQCPNCTETFEIEEVDIKQYKYCPYCGQHWDNIKLDYMEED